MTKVYIPRIFIPVAPVLSGLVDFAIGLVVLAGHARAGTGSSRRCTSFLLPFFILFAIVTAIAVTLWLSALNVRYRDVQYTLPFLVQAWFFATPVAYSALVFPAHLRMCIGVNPMAGVVQGFRWAIIGTQAAQVGHLMLAVVRRRARCCSSAGSSTSAASRGASRMSSEALVLRVEGLGRATGSASASRTRRCATCSPTRSPRPYRAGARHAGARSRRPRTDLGALGRLLRRAAGRGAGADRRGTAPASRRC